MSLSHIVLSCKANWSTCRSGITKIGGLMWYPGHLRSMCILSARIAHSRAVHITILVADTGSVVDRVTQEVSRCTDVEEVDCLSEVRYVNHVAILLNVYLYGLRSVLTPSQGRWFASRCQRRRGLGQLIQACLEGSYEWRSNQMQLYLQACRGSSEAFIRGTRCKFVCSSAHLLSG
jgi:hypothetical protein